MLEGGEMRNRMTSLVLVAGMLVLVTGLAHGAGFSIYEANSKASRTSMQMAQAALELGRR